MTTDLLSMWIAGQYDELFATLKAMKPSQRNQEISRLTSAMADFDNEQRNDGIETDECDRFWAEIDARL